MRPRAARDPVFDRERGSGGRWRSAIPRTRSGAPRSGVLASRAREEARMTIRRSEPAKVVERVRVVPKHHALVRLSHWANVPLLFGLIASGLAIYWAAPVFVHARDPVTGSREYIADLGIAISRVLHQGGESWNWVYNHLSLGPRQLAIALRMH